jgi:hypothetical protein
MKGVMYGDSFLLSVIEGNLDNQMTESDLSMIGTVADEVVFRKAMLESVQEHGGGDRLYLCIPIGRAWTDDDGADDDATNAPNRVVSSEWAETQIEKMVAAANAMGVSDEP